MDWLDEVREIWGKCTEQEASDLLWMCTAFPAADVEHVKKQLVDIKEKSGGDYDRALAIADAEIGEAMRNPTPKPTPTKA